jgi:hypothetical protein
LLVALLAAAPRDCHAAGDELLTVKSSSIGFGGKFKSGFWQPVRATLVAGQAPVRGRLEVVAADGDQTPVIYANEQASELNLSPQQETTVLLYAKSGPVAAPLVLQLRSAAGVLWSQNLATPSIGASQEFVVGIGPAAGLEDTAAVSRRRSESTLVTAQVQSAAELPDAWWA